MTSARVPALDQEPDQEPDRAAEPLETSSPGPDQLHCPAPPAIDPAWAIPATAPALAIPAIGRVSATRVIDLETDLGSVTQVTVPAILETDLVLAIPAIDQVTVLASVIPATVLETAPALAILAIARPVRVRPVRVRPGSGLRERDRLARGLRDIVLVFVPPARDRLAGVLRATGLLAGGPPAIDRRSDRRSMALASGVVPAGVGAGLVIAATGGRGRLSAL